MKAFLDCLRVVFGFTVLLAIGCGAHVTPYIRTSTTSPTGVPLYTHRNIIYEVPTQFKIFHDKQNEITVLFKENHDFGIHCDVPRVGYDKTKGPSENVGHVLPLLKKDLEREGRKEVRDVTQSFGSNTFYGFAYKEETYHRETFDGVIVVGKSYIIVQIYFPSESDTKKYPKVKDDIFAVLEKMKHV